MTSWVAESEVLEHAQGGLAEAQADMSAGQAGAGLRWLEAVGKLSVLEAPLPTSVQGDEALVQSALAELDADALEDAAQAIVEEADALEFGNADAERVVAALELRSTWQFVAQAAEQLGSLVLTQDQEVALMVFEQAVEPVLHQLLPMNEYRARSLRAVAPKYRPKFWWLSRGVHLPATALDALGVTAELLETFPRAEDYFRRLRRSQQLLDAQAVKTPAANVVSLLAWVAQKRGQVDAGESPLLAAGFDTGETTLLHSPDFDLSWADPDRLIVDLIADRAPDRVPVLRAGSTELVPVAVEEAEERYEFRLPPELLAVERLTLELPFESGVQSIDLPIDG